MTKNEAYALGQTAYAAGKGNFLTACPEIAAELEHAKVGEKTHLMKAFSDGWWAAQFAATEQELRELIPGWCA